MQDTYKPRQGQRQKRRIALPTCLPETALIAPEIIEVDRQSCPGRFYRLWPGGVHNTGSPTRTTHAETNFSAASFASLTVSFTLNDAFTICAELTI